MAVMPASSTTRLVKGRLFRDEVDSLSSTTFRSMRKRMPKDCAVRHQMDDAIDDDKLTSLEVFCSQPIGRTLYEQVETARSDVERAETAIHSLQRKFALVEKLQYDLAQLEASRKVEDEQAVLEALETSHHSVIAKEEAMKRAREEMMRERVRKRLEQDPTLWRPAEQPPKVVLPSDREGWSPEDELRFAAFLRHKRNKLEKRGAKRAVTAPSLAPRSGIGRGPRPAVDLGKPAAAQSKEVRSTEEELYWPKCHIPTSEALELERNVDVLARIFTSQT